MHLGAPYFLWLLLPALLLPLMRCHADRRNRLGRERFAAGRYGAADRAPSGRAGMWVATLALTAGVLALARPQWEGAPTPETGRRLDILIALDTSRSMLVGDVAPSRLGAAKGAVTQLIRRLSGDRIGLIGFAGTAFALCPLTTDYDAFLRVLDEADERSLPREGTSLAGCLDEARAVFARSRSAHGVLILISDGEEHEGDALKAAAAARQAGITVFTLPVGTAAGGLIPTGSPGLFLKDRDGNVVNSRGDRLGLDRIARAAGGVSLSLDPSREVLAALYRDRLSRLERSVSRSKAAPRYRELFPIPLAVAVALLFAAPQFERRRGKR